MSIVNAVSFADIRARGSIREEDVKRLRAAFYDDGEISRDEADELFALNDACPVQAPAWPDFFIEAITDFTVNQERPEGYLTKENADWLIARISADGKVQTKTELELLINVIDRSRWSPASLSIFALDQVKTAVLDGDGPIRSGQELRPGVITSGDVELLRRILYAFGGDGANGITRKEAEILFEINDAVEEADCAPEWTDLFVKAITNAVMAASGYKAPPREEALRRLEWIEKEADLSMSGILGRIGEGFAGYLDVYNIQTPEERSIARLERQKIEIITNERITQPEANWLAERIGRDGIMKDNEKALLSCIAKESPAIHPALQELIDKVARAA